MTVQVTSIQPRGECRSTKDGLICDGTVCHIPYALCGVSKKKEEDKQSLTWPLIA